MREVLTPIHVRPFSIFFRFIWRFIHFPRSDPIDWCLDRGSTLDGVPRTGSAYLVTVVFKFLLRPAYILHPPGQVSGHPVSICDWNEWGHNIFEDVSQMYDFK